MKRIFILSIFSLLTLPIFAQRASDADLSYLGGYDEWNHSAVFTEYTIGGQVGDIDGDFGVGLALGYRWHVWNGLSWDILKIGANAGVSHFSDTLDLRFLTGFRYNSPALFSDKGLYANVAFGYHFLTEETDFDGFAYEIGAGVNLNRHVSLGITWEGSNFSYYDYTSNWGIIGLKLGVIF